MKKVIISALFAVLATASIASATSTWTNVTTPTFSGDLADGPTVGSTVFQVSTNVTLIGDGDLGGYNAGSKHTSGDKEFVSSSISASIEEITTGVLKGVVLEAIPTAPTTANIYTGSMGGY